MCFPRNNLCAVAFSALLLSACAIPRKSSIDDMRLGSVTVEIDNREFADLRIYLERAGASLQLGCVEGLTKRKLVVSTAYGVTTSQLVLRAVTLSGAEALRSPTVTVEPGQVISWRVEQASRGTAIMVK